MHIYERLADIISAGFLFELKHTIADFHESSVVKGFPIPPGHGLAVLGSESYSSPFVACITIPVPQTLDEASQLCAGWMNFVSQALQNLDDDLSPTDIRDLFMSIVIAESRKCGINPEFNMKLGAFWVSHLKNSGVSFDEQVSRNKQVEVTGHFYLHTSYNKCLLFSEKVGYRENHCG